MALDHLRQDRLDRLEAALAGLLPEGVALACADPAVDAPEGAMFAAEAAAMVRAVAKRRAEFAAGRMAARRAMAALGRAPAAVAMGPDRAPVWPAGLVGSIAHCESACVALIGARARWAALAVDIEPDVDLPGEVAELICRPEERAWLERQPAAARGRAARLIFTAKECAYKLQYPLTGKLLDFGEVAVVVDAAAERFELGFPAAIGAKLPPGATRGRFGRVEGFLFCVMHAPQSTDKD